MIFKTKKDDFGRTHAGINNDIVSSVKGVFNGDFFKEQQLFSDSDIKAIKAYNAEIDKGTTSQMAFRRTMKDTSEEAQNVVAAANGGKIAIDGLTKSSKAAELGMKALSMAGNMIAAWAIGEVISLVVTGIDNLVHASEHTEENAKEFTDGLSELNKTQNSNIETISSLNDEYKKLSSGVNSLGENVSLTTDQYNRYHEITNQVAELMPNLVQGWDAQGNAILKVKGNLADLNEEYKKKAQNDAIKEYNSNKDGYDDIGTTFDTKSVASNYFDYSYSGTSKMYNFSTKNGSTDQVLSQMQKLYNGSMSFDDYKDKLHSILNKDEDYTDEEAAFLMAVNVLLDNTGKLSIKTADEYQDFQSNIRDIYNQAYNDINTVTNQVQMGALGYAKTTDAYWNSDYQTQINSLLNNLTSGVIVKNGLQSEDSMKNFVNRLIGDINDNKDGVQKALNSLFNIDIENTDLNPVKLREKIRKAIEDVLKALNIKYDDATINQLSDKFGFRGVDATADRYNSVLKSNKKKYGDDLSDFFEKNSINTDEELDKWTSITETITDANEAQKAYLNTSVETNEPKSFKQAWKDLDNADDDSGMKNTKKDLTALAESGKLTRKTFEATEGAKTWLSQIEIDADVAIKKINDLVDSSKQLNSLKSSIKSIQDAYADKRDNGVAGADTLSGMESEFGKLKSWNEFKNTLGSTTSTLADCQEAQNKLASEYVNSNNFLSQLTEENKDYYTSQLKDLGIKNAQEIVTTQLENKAKSLNLEYSALSKEQKKTVKSGEELAKMSGTDIAMLLGEANGSKKARIELAKLAYQTTNWSDLDATQTIKQLNNITEAAGIADNSISLYKNALNEDDPNKYHITIQGSSLEAAAKANGMTVAEYAKKMAVDQVGNELNKKGKKTRTKIDIDFSLPKVTDSGKGSGSSSSSSNKVFDWIEVRLKRLEDKVKKTVDKINDYASKKTKNGLFKQAKKQYDDLLHGYEIAAKKYKKKLDSINLSSDLKKKIQSGDYSIQTIKESAKKGKSKKSQKSVLDAIDSYQEYWDKYTSARDNITETKQNKRELIKKQLEDDISDLEDDLDLLQYEADKTQSRIDKNETKGFAATKNDYKEEISNSKKQISKWNQEKKAYRAYLKDNKIASSSDEYQDIQKKIRDIDKNIFDAKKNQLEWNKSISELPYQNLEKFKNILDAISSRYEKIISFWESQGHTKNESQITKQISIGLNELSQLKKERDEKWKQINQTLSDKGLNSFKKMQFKALYEGMREGTITVDQFYKSISKLGISKEIFDSWDGLQDKLQEVDGLDGDILDKQAEIENNYDDLLTPWINSIQDLIDKINDLNDAQSKAIELEKLQQALQSAKQNKKNLIYHEDYAFNYEADNNAVKEAQDNLDDYYNQEQLDTLNKILDWLNDHKEDVNFFDENGKPLYKTVDEAVKAVTKGMTKGMSESVKKMFDSLTFSIDKNGKITASVPKYATGTKYAKGGMSIVGEKGAELRLLNSGDQILPHDITDNLWKFGVNPTKMILDNIQIPDMSNLVKNTGDKMVNNNVSIGTVALPNINDLSKVNDIFSALSGLSSYAHQQANKR